MANYVRFFDAVSIEPEITTEIKDYYQNAPEGTQVNPLRVRIAATHSGKITRNNGFYLPSKMKDGAKTFTQLYPKPIQVHHDDHSDPIGRVIKASYIDISNGIRNEIADSITAAQDKKLLDFIKGKLGKKETFDYIVETFIKDGSLVKDKDYEGLGYVEIIAEITDRDAIQKVLDKRYLTGSVGASTDQAVCSVCKQDWAEEGMCEHEPGKIYDEVKCVLIAGDLSYEEYSFVNRPADTHSKVIEVNVNGIQDFVYGEEENIINIKETESITDTSNTNTTPSTNILEEEKGKVNLMDRSEEILDLLKQILTTLQSEKEEEAKEGECESEDKVTDKVSEKIEEKTEDSTIVAETITEEAKVEDNTEVKSEEVTEGTPVVEKTEEIVSEVIDELTVAKEEIKNLHNDIELLNKTLVDTTKELRELLINNILLIDSTLSKEELSDKTLIEIKKILDSQIENKTESNKVVDENKTSDIINTGLTNENPILSVESPLHISDNKVEEKKEGESDKQKIFDKLTAKEQLQFFDIRLKFGNKVAQQFLDSKNVEKKE